MKIRDLEDEILAHLCVAACGTADAPTLEYVTQVEPELVEAALARLLSAGEVEAVGVAFRVSDLGRARLNGGRS